jgi:hypothetical protein
MPVCWCARAASAHFTEISCHVIQQPRAADPRSGGGGDGGYIWFPAERHSHSAVNNHPQSDFKDATSAVKLATLEMARRVAELALAMCGLGTTLGTVKQLVRWSYVCRARQLSRKSRFAVHLETGNAVALLRSDIIPTEQRYR